MRRMTRETTQQAAQEYLWNVLVDAAWGCTRDAIWVAVRSGARRDIEHATVDAGRESTQP